MNNEQTQLWQRIEACVFDEPGADLPFTARLARDNDWSHAFARRVIEEYRRFAFLCVAAGHRCTPSVAVDHAWHLHLIYTRNYWDEFCPNVLGQPLHHGPTRGGRDEEAKFHDWYERTLNSYRNFFGTEPPSDIWPPARQRFSDEAQMCHVNRRQNWIIPKPGYWPRKLAAMLASVAVGALLLPAIVTSGAAQSAAAQSATGPNPILRAELGLPGILIPALFGVVAAALIIRSAIRGGKKKGNGDGSGGDSGSNCGTYGGTSDGSGSGCEPDGGSSDGCSGGCGGGCGGGD